MSTITTPSIEWQRVQKYANMPARNGTPVPRDLLEYLSGKMQEFGFDETACKDERTKWAYAKLGTFLEDGWSSQARYTKVRDDCLLGLNQFGCLVNSLVAGSRYEQAQAKAIGCPWTFEGVFPSRGDLAAFLFYVACEPPKIR